MTERDLLLLAVPDWEPPWPVDSSGSYVRVTTSMLRGRSCAEQTARKARPDSFPSGDRSREPAGVGSFPLGMVFEAVSSLLSAPIEPGADAGELIHATVRRAVEENWQDWPAESIPAIEAGVAGYLEAVESLLLSGELVPGRVVTDLVVEAASTTGGPDEREASVGRLERVELWTWAIHHLSADGRVREVHLLRWQDATSSTLSDAEIAGIAEIASAGVVAAHAKWYQRFIPLPDAEQPPVPERVVVRLIGVLDGSSDVRFDGTVDQAHALFTQQVPGALTVLAGGSTRPSHACAGCNVREVCPGLPAMPGLLGVAGFSPTTRSLSPSMLRTHRACARQLYLTRDLGLPRERQAGSAALRRGTEVHEWLRRAHERGRACRAEDLPEWSVEPAASASVVGPSDPVPERPLHEELGWSREEYQDYLPYLRQHLDHCPWALDGVEAVLGELDITVWDTDANVVFSTRPDSAHLGADGRWTLRETKTLSPRHLPTDPTDLLGAYPQVAAAICLLADGYRPDAQPQEEPGRVDLELLGVDEGHVVSYDASDPYVVLVARTALADRADPWLHDTVHAVGEHAPCHSCEVTRWCADRPEGALSPGAGIPLAELVTDAAWHTTAPEHHLREAEGAAMDDDEEFPF